MNASYRAAQKLLRDRRRANTKRTITTHVARTTTDQAAIKGVTAALRKTARDLRTAGQLGKVQTRTERVAAGVVGKTYRYTAAQIALIAAAYRPRKEAYKLVATRLALAA